MEGMAKVPDECVVNAYNLLKGEAKQVLNEGDI